MRSLKGKWIVKGPLEGKKWLAKKVIRCAVTIKPHLVRVTLEPKSATRKPHDGNVGLPVTVTMDSVRSTTRNGQGTDDR